MTQSRMVVVKLPLPLEVLRPLGAPAIGPPPLPVSLSTAALFTDMEKFLCEYKKGGREQGEQKSTLNFVFATTVYLES